jgi:hypothetical protein
VMTSWSGLALVVVQVGLPDAPLPHGAPGSSWVSRS